MIDGNQLREEFGRYLAEHKATRWGMDAALMHVCKIAYDAGKADEARAEHACGVAVQPCVETFDVDFLARLGAEVPAPAEVPMPQGYVERPSDYTGDIWIESQMRTYGVACRAAGEAAGYARGLRDAVRDADIEALRLYVRALCKAVDAATDFAGTVAGGEPCQSVCLTPELTRAAVSARFHREPEAASG